MGRFSRKRSPPPSPPSSLLKVAYEKVAYVIVAQNCETLIVFIEILGNPELYYN
jgi:hypothetical protein